MGPTTGMAQIPASRLPFGKSIVVPAVINWLSTIAWDAINAFFGAYAISVVTGDAVPFPVGLLIVVACQAALEHRRLRGDPHVRAMGGDRARDPVRGRDGGRRSARPTSRLADGDAASIGSFVLMTTIAGSFNLAWALYASDYSRYLPGPTRRAPRSSRTRSSALALLGDLDRGARPRWWSAHWAGGRTVQQINTLGGGIVGVLAMVAIFFGTVAVNAMNDYTGSLSLLAAGIRVKRPILGGASSRSLASCSRCTSTRQLRHRLSELPAVHHLLDRRRWRRRPDRLVAAGRPARRQLEGRRLRPPADRPNALVALVVGFVVGSRS